jgi:hypothetical protein
VRASFSSLTSGCWPLLESMKPLVQAQLCPGNPDKARLLWQSQVLVLF